MEKMILILKSTFVCAAGRRRLSCHYRVRKNANTNTLVSFLHTKVDNCISMSKKDDKMNNI